MVQDWELWELQGQEWALRQQQGLSWEGKVMVEQGRELEQEEMHLDWSPSRGRSSTRR